MKCEPAKAAVQVAAAEVPIMFPAADSGRPNTKGFPMNLPEIETDGPNFTTVRVGNVLVWFSYTTAIGFQVDGKPRVVRDNRWGPTTGKHLNKIDDGDKKSRVSGEEFQRRWDAELSLLSK